MVVGKLLNNNKDCCCVISMLLLLPNLSIVNYYDIILWNIGMSACNPVCHQDYHHPLTSWTTSYKRSNQMALLMQSATKAHAPSSQF